MTPARSFLCGCLTVATVVVLDVCGRLWLLAPPVAILAALWMWGGVRHLLAGSDRRARRAYDIGRTVGYAAGRAEAWLEAMKEKA